MIGPDFNFFRPVHMERFALGAWDWLRYFIVALPEPSI